MKCDCELSFGIRKSLRGTCLDRMSAAMLKEVVLSKRNKIRAMKDPRHRSQTLRSIAGSGEYEALELGVEAVGRDFRKTVTPGTEKLDKTL